MSEEPITKSVTYADAGVDITSGDRAKDRIKYLAQKTFNRNVLGGIGGFGALFRWIRSAGRTPSSSAPPTASAPSSRSPSRWACTTPWAPIWSPLRQRHRRAGRHAPLLPRLLASGKLNAEVTESVISGLADACKANGCALIGGETAQMPGFYTDGEYDLAGFIVGAVDRDKIVTGAGIKAGDVLIGLPSTGLHTNGYSLARKLFFEVAGYKHTQYVTAIKEKAGAALMKTHRSYCRSSRSSSPPA